MTISENPAKSLPATEGALEFRLLDHDSMALIVPLYVSVFNAAPWNDGWHPMVVLERLQSFAQFPRFECMVLLCDGQPVAAVLGWGERWVNSWVFHIKEMFVNGARQRQGLGKHLFEAFETCLRLKGFTGAYLQTGEAAPARQFYEQMGYERFNVVSLRKRFV
ncbi:MAG: GNAT family N-acetyltransferase [Rhodocyclaceae bacterium]